MSIAICTGFSSNCQGHNIDRFREKEVQQQLAPVQVENHSEFAFSCVTSRWQSSVPWIRVLSLIESSIIPISFNFNYSEFRLIRCLLLIRVLLALTSSSKWPCWLNLLNPTCLNSFALASSIRVSRKQDKKKGRANDFSRIEFHSYRTDIARKAVAWKISTITIHNLQKSYSYYIPCFSFSFII